MDDPITWADILLSASTTIGAGVIAGIVAWRTVRWTQQGDKEAAELAESNAKEAARMQEARHAAEQLHKALHAYLAGLNEVAPGRSPDYSTWSDEFLVQLPILEDYDHELAVRASRVNNELFLFAVWVRQAIHDSNIETERMPEEIERASWEVGQHITWLGRNISRFRVGKDLPDIIEQPSKVDLPGIDRSAEVDPGEIDSHAETVVDG